MRCDRTDGNNADYQRLVRDVRGRYAGREGSNGIQRMQRFSCWLAHSMQVDIGLLDVTFRGKTLRVVPCPHGRTVSDQRAGFPARAQAIPSWRSSDWWRLMQAAQDLQITA